MEMWKWKNKTFQRANSRCKVAVFTNAETVNFHIEMGEMRTEGRV